MKFEFYGLVDNRRNLQKAYVLPSVELIKEKFLRLKKRHLVQEIALGNFKVVRVTLNASKPLKKIGLQEGAGKDLQPLDSHPL